MPSKSEHICRLREVSAFREENFEREERDYEGKKYYAAVGFLKETEELADYENYYPRETWTAEDAQKQCELHSGIEFYPAQDGDENKENQDVEQDKEMPKDDPAQAIKKHVLLGMRRAFPRKM